MVALSTQESVFNAAAQVVQVRIAPNDMLEELGTTTLSNYSGGQSGLYIVQ